jgi:hypothetical protein
VLVCFFFLVNLVDYGLLVFEFTLGERLLLLGVRFDPP